MRNFLGQVMKERAADAMAAARETPLELLAELAEGAKRRSFISRLSASGTHIIAETKKASPSAGLLRKDYNSSTIAVEYERCGAAGISVLTEPRHFLGSLDDLRAARAAVELPILRKDFISVPYQVYEAAANGADAILLICAMLSSSALQELHETAKSLGLETIAESHSEAELELALLLPDAIIGVNSRDLKTLKTDLAVAKSLIGAVPKDRLAVAESGIKMRAEIEELSSLGYRGFLIGEAFLRAAAISESFRQLSGI